MLKGILAGLVGLIICGSAALGQTCASYPYTFANGTVADANQVNSNFSSILGCANTYLAPLASPSFTGNASFGGNISVTGTSSLTGNVGIGVAPSSDALEISSAVTNANIFALDGPLTISTSGGNYAVITPHVTQTLNSSFSALRLVPTMFPTTAIHLTANGMLNNILIQPSTSGSFTFDTINGNTTNLGFRTTYSASVQRFNAFNAQDLSNTSSGSPGLTTQVGFNAAALAGGASNAGVVIDEAGGSNHSDIVLGQSVVPSGAFGIYDNSPQSNYFLGKVGIGPGATAPAQALDVTGSAHFSVSVGIGTTAPAQALEVNGKVQVDSFAAGTMTNVCLNANVLATCSSSIRYKENIKDASFGLADVEKMRPVTFKWKGRDENDLGLVAEEVAKINPLFATYRDGRVEGVKYAQLTAVLVNAIKELKSANDTQAAQIAQLQSQVSELRRKANLQTAMEGGSARRMSYVNRQP